MRVHILFVMVLLVAGCSSADKGVRVSQDVQTPAVAPAPKVASRTEPIFYNGKTYTLKFAPTDGGVYAMSVLGMGAGQKKDAIAVATSSLRYFKCKDGQNGLLKSGPSYVDSTWNLTAKCG